jgi:hypothetical protein
MTKYIRHNYRHTNIIFRHTSMFVLSALKFEIYLEIHEKHKRNLSVYIQIKRMDLFDSFLITLAIISLASIQEEINI